MSINAVVCLSRAAFFTLTRRAGWIYTNVARRPSVLRLTLDPSGKFLFAALRFFGIPSFQISRYRELYLRKYLETKQAAALKCVYYIEPLRSLWLGYLDIYS
jgi:hypothetical protein